MFSKVISSNQIDMTLAIGHKDHRVMIHMIGMALGLRVGKMVLMRECRAVCKGVGKICMEILQNLCRERGLVVDRIYMEEILNLEDMICKEELHNPCRKVCPEKDMICMEGILNECKEECLEEDMIYKEELHNPCKEVCQEKDIILKEEILNPCREAYLEVNLVWKVVNTT